MKVITKIEYQKKNKDRVSIYLDEEFAFGLDLDSFVKFQLHKGMELDDDSIQKMLNEEDFRKCKNYSLDLVSKYRKTEKQIRDKLTQREYAPSSIDMTIEFLKKYNMINDLYYAECFFNDRIHLSKQGVNKIRQDLYLKGISKEIIESVVSQYNEDKESNQNDEDLEFNNAKTWAEKKLRQLTKDDIVKKKQKTYAFLVRKGFPFSIINKVITEALEELESE